MKIDGINLCHAGITVKQFEMTVSFGGLVRDDSFNMF